VPELMHATAMWQRPWLKECDFLPRHPGAANAPSARVDQGTAAR
jgi:hypothetical protein